MGESRRHVVAEVIAGPLLDHLVNVAMDDLMLLLLSSRASKVRIY